MYMYMYREAIPRQRREGSRRLRVMRGYSRAVHRIDRPVYHQFSIRQLRRLVSETQEDREARLQHQSAEIGF